MCGVAVLHNVAEPKRPRLPDTKRPALSLGPRIQLYSFSSSRVHSHGKIRSAGHTVVTVAGPPTPPGTSSSTTEEEFELSDRAPETSEDRVTPHLEIVILAQNRAESLRKLWESLDAADYGEAHADAEEPRALAAAAAAGGGGGVAGSFEGGVVRAFTAIYYLGDGPWTADGDVGGGALRLWPAGSYEAVELAPVGDRLVVFDSTLSHEVRPNEADERRCAFTQWFSAVVPAAAST